jgi:ribosome biogenesis protein BMS1
MVDHFDPRSPLLVGGLARGEEAAGYMQLRLKRHRWFPKTLKNRDPLVLSVGWRRFQSLPVFAIEDNNGRHRMLKYTPDHMHCLASVWGPLAPPGTGVLAVQRAGGGGAAAAAQHWRIAATGVVLQLDATLRVVKKLKLVGAPVKVHRHTAFVGGMFNSQLEASKFEGASVRTVSGIRGTIKKAVRAGTAGAREGAFRATFEDKPLLSDSVFLRAWVAVEVPKFSTPVTNLLAPRAALAARAPKPPKNRKAAGDEEDEEEGGGGGVAAAGQPADATVAAAEGAAEFAACDKFKGARAGYVFKRGAQGLGYYGDGGGIAGAGSARGGGGAAPAAGGAAAAAAGGAPSDGWVGVRSVADLRREAGVGAPRLSDSLYRPVERGPRRFNPLRVPAALQAALPFKSKPKVESKRSRPTLEQRRAVVLEPGERRAVTLVAQLNAIRNARAGARREQRARQQTKIAKKVAGEEAWRAQYNKEERKKRYVERGQADKRAAKKQRGD